jgi:hypothetical protein
VLRRKLLTALLVGVLTLTGVACGGDDDGDDGDDAVQAAPVTAID